MFGKPEWFKQTSCCKGVYPTSLKGLLYFVTWVALIALPMTGLAMAGKVFPEAAIWLGFSSVAFLWDMRDIRRQLQAAYDRKLYFIGGEEPEPAELTTRHFDMKLRG